jgi:hypothetical protein
MKENFVLAVHKGNVALMFRPDEAPDGLCYLLSPHRARLFADALLDFADQAEGELPPGIDGLKL